MINTNRVVSVTKVDLLTLYGNIMKLAGTTVAAVDAGAPGVFVVSSGSGNKITSEPVKSLDFGADVSSMVVYFIPAYDYEGFKIAGTAVTPAAGSVEVDADSVTLYTATLSSGDVTIAKVGF